MNFSQRESLRVSIVLLKEQILSDNELVIAVMSKGDFHKPPDLSGYKFVLIKEGEKADHDCDMCRNCRYRRWYDCTAEIRDYGYTNPDMLNQMIYDLEEYQTEKEGEK